MALGGDMHGEEEEAKEQDTHHTHEPPQPYRFTTLQALEKHISDITTRHLDGLELFFDNADVVQDRCGVCGRVWCVWACSRV